MREENKNMQIVKSYREVLGQGLASMRNDKGISTYRIRQSTKLNHDTISQIETGSAAYTIDSLLKYLQAIDVYVFFADKEGKQKTPIDIGHMITRKNNNDPKL